jgi:GntR family transcriptional regulator
MGTRHEQIAGHLRAAIECGDTSTGDALPTENDLAQRYGVSRGTVRHALSALAAEGLISSRQGARRVVLGGHRSHNFAELRSFAQWARAMGRTATGLVIDSRRRPATPTDAADLRVPADSEVLAVLRLRRLDGEPVLVERTVYAGWIADAVERIEIDADSVTDRLYERENLVFAYGRHLIDAVAAGTTDAHLLGIRRGSPLQRIRCTTTDHAGRPVECSDDRYRPSAVTFVVHNSINANPLTRRPPDDDPADDDPAEVRQVEVGQVEGTAENQDGVVAEHRG